MLEELMMIDDWTDYGLPSRLSITLTLTSPALLYAIHCCALTLTST